LELIKELYYDARPNKSQDVEQCLYDKAINFTTDCCI